MRNLAGDKLADNYIAAELFRCRVAERKIAADERGEVPATIGGVIAGPMGPIILRRAWTYWIAVGPVPLAIADRLYADPGGVDHIRVDGHCGCPSPGAYAIGEDGNEYVNRYHIDTELGLRLFADALEPKP